ncbi:hypothetical protein [Sphingobium subterraneum]|uniref:Uncharacterized protein n=1 Tax=Sphingobium subterraneum TaxID=627688 RepID=A0A841J4S5_9SPHN|nr:hypothetical protein [Sphingobium subterraneum]MBB6123241.1 hypothetical protein [Sphingobium subterraneum]
MRKKKRVNGQAVREWLNVIAAVGALLVGVVSFWTTARISGLEDYLRSEIGRRNTELNALSSRSERAQLLAERRAESLSRLQFSADELAGSFAATQARLEQAKDRLGDVQAQLGASQQRLSDLDKRSSLQAGQLDLLSRRRVLQDVSLRLIFHLMSDESQSLLGQAAYTLITTSAAGRDENDLIPYFDQLRHSATFTCGPLKSFAPDLLKQKPYPKSPEPPGRKVAGQPGVRMMTRTEQDEWGKAEDEHSRIYGEVSTFNTAAVTYNIDLRRYASESAQECVCLALATEVHPASSICPGLTHPTLPKRPDGLQEEN